MPWVWVFILRKVKALNLNHPCKEYADIANVLRIHQEVPSNSVRRAGQVLSNIMGGLKPKQYKVFAHKLLMDDMAKDVESGLLEDPEALPFGFTIKTARSYLAKLNAIIEKDPVIKDAIRRRTEFNNKLRDAFEKAGIRFSGLSPNGNLVEMIELTDHPWFVGCQFHPEFKSKPFAPHPLFAGFIGAALKRHRERSP